MLPSNVQDTFSVMNNDPNFVKLVAPIKLISSYLRDFLIVQPFLWQSDLMTILQVHMKLNEANHTKSHFWLVVISKE